MSAIEQTTFDESIHGLLNSGTNSYSNKDLHVPYVLVPLLESPHTLITTTIETSFEAFSVIPVIPD